MNILSHVVVMELTALHSQEDSKKYGSLDILTYLMHLVCHFATAVKTKMYTRIIQ